MKQQQQQEELLAKNIDEDIKYFKEVIGHLGALQKERQKYVDSLELKLNELRLQVKKADDFTKKAQDEMQENLDFLLQEKKKREEK